MAEECTQQIPLGAATSSMPNWWPDLHASSLSSWGSCNTNSAANNHQLSGGCEEDVSISTSNFTNASNHSGGGGGGGLSSVDSSRHDHLIGDSSSDHTNLWRHLLLNSGSSLELNNSHGLGDNMSNTMSSKCSTNGMFEPVSNYLKKIETNWDYTHEHNHFANQTHLNINGSERLSNLSNLVNNWSIAPPTTPSETMNINLCHMKQPININSKNLFGSFLPYGHHDDIKMVNDGLHRQQFDCNRVVEYGQQMGSYDHNEPHHVVEDIKGKYGYHGMTDLPVGSFTDAISYGSTTTALCKPTHKASNFSTSSNRKNGLRSSNLSYDSSTRSSSHSQGSRGGGGARGGHGIPNEGKKKRNEENPETNNTKKPKNENSTVSPTKVPKVKLTDKVTALQQIVSPFGKTDTASVLWEAIGYIKFLQEQVQLLSNPYMKTNINKDQWGSMERKDRGDLESRGLCLVPLSCTPQVYRETSGSVDYWTPTYRGCLYR
ncbi:transcription factor bHLH111 isoform X2 [Impatiens glandulifera]|uniref:transcription factor bHLH111 isoform X2 n=1 Tax=Impatiens glandulifera TaxID=253017 RepID=UPI001FB08A6C|nr:transcription factor bHLH111 isoform X2 [Impatiens glandulifera]